MRSAAPSPRCGKKHEPGRRDYADVGHTNASRECRHTCLHLPSGCRDHQSGSETVA